MSDLNINWLQDFVDERIALSHKTTSAAPNTVYSGVSVDRFGHVLNGEAGSSVLIAIANRHTSQTINAGANTRIDYSDVWYDPGNTITTGASWVFTPPSNAWYAFTLIAYVVPGGAPNQGERLRFEWRPDGSGGNIHLLDDWEAGLNYAYTPNGIAMRGRQVEYCATTDSPRIHLSNGTANNVTISSKYFNRIIIEKVKEGA